MVITMREAANQLAAAAVKFIAKVDSGQARSTVTYRELKAALETYKEALLTE